MRQDAPFAQVVAPTCRAMRVLESHTLNNCRSLQRTLPLSALPLSRLIAAPTEGRIERRLFSKGEGNVGLLLLVGVAISHDAQNLAHGLLTREF